MVLLVGRAGTQEMHVGVIDVESGDVLTRLTAPT
jgi:hypothetical protein